MAYTSEIEKLEQRFAENRRGRTFAPLADAYRKAGLIDNAIELCQEGLKLHPDYVSAWIVYGRCYLDKRDDPAAHEVYEKVLGLDPENVLALKALAEIADRGNRPDEAAGWLTQLLQADPMNGEAAEALARAKGKAAAAGKVFDVDAPPVRAASPRAPVPAPSRTATPVSTPKVAARKQSPAAPPPPPAIEIERASDESDAAVPTSVGQGLELENTDSVVEVNEEARRAAKAQGIEVQEEVDLKPDPIQVEGLAPTQYEGSGMFQVDHLPKPESEPERQPEPAQSSAPIDLPLIMPEELDAAAERRAPTPPPAPMPPPLSSPPPASPVRARLADDDGAADRAALSQAEPVVTETMAELYLRQGHKADALRVYRALAQQRPGDGRLQSKIESLAASHTGGGGAFSGQSAGAFLRSLLHPGAAPPTGRGPGGQSGQVSDLLASAFANAGDVLGEPTKPADDSISLDAVFGDSDGQGKSRPVSDGAAPKAPASPPTSAAPEKGFSFDEFFSHAPGNAPGGSTGTQGTRTSGRHSRPPTDDPSEVDQFQAWLKKLKS